MKLKVREPVPEVDEPIELYEEAYEGDVEEAPPSLPSAPKKKDKWLTFMKVIVLFCLANGIAWVWCSYILAWMGKEQIAESLSQVALTEIIGVVLVYAIKSGVENLSKNNSWPDKHGSTPSDGVG